MTTLSSVRVLFVYPGPIVSSRLLFVRKQIDSLVAAGVSSQEFSLQSRTSLVILASEWVRFQREIRSFRPDIVHAQYGTATSAFCALSSSAPIIVTFRGSDLNPAPSASFMRSILGRMLSQLSALRARRIICVSEDLRERLWWRKDVSTVIPSGVDTDIFRPKPRLLARQSLGWRADEKVVLFNAGNNPKAKRLDLAESAIRVAEARCGQIRFAVLDGSVPPERVSTMMSAADCLLFTSDWEGSPNIVKEAIACNLPVVSVDAGDIRERLMKISPSRVVDRRPDALGRALSEILERGARSNGEQEIRHLSCANVAERILRVYRQALSERVSQAERRT